MTQAEGYPPSTTFDNISPKPRSLINNFIDLNHGSRLSRQMRPAQKWHSCTWCPDSPQRESAYYADTNGRDLPISPKIHPQSRAPTRQGRKRYQRRL